MKKINITLIILFFFGLCIPINGKACVGKTIVIGTKDTSTVQRVLDEMLALLINERTGTSVKVVNFNNAADCRKAIMSAEVDMYIEYTGSALTEVLNMTEVKDADKAFEIVKNEYNEKYNLVWLPPYGFDYQNGLKEEFKGKGIPAVAAPVIRKDTLKKFPALARLLQKLSGKISNETLDGLVGKVKGDNFKEVARQFLKENKLI